ncbi:MAG TPA: SEC-C metal-binding domain-containing protein [Trebonia sp.]|jgi:hypothetical protein
MTTAEPQDTAAAPTVFGGSGTGSSRRSGSGGRHRRKPASDGVDHATAAGRGEAATRSGDHGDVSAADEVEAALPAGLRPNRPAHLEYSAPSDSGGVEHHSDSSDDEFASVGRNDPCPCGSGKKFKRCHGDPRAQ